jgi:hypothetical protein
MGIENIDVKLAKFGLKRIVNFFYNASDYLFDVIAYLLKYNETSKSIRKKKYIIFENLFKYWNT